MRAVVSTMATRHNLPAYEAAGLEAHHVAVPATGREDALEEMLRCCGARCAVRSGAVHGNRYTDFVAAVCAAHLHEHRDDPEDALAEAREAGLMVTPEACALLGVDYSAVQPRARMAAST